MGLGQVASSQLILCAEKIRSAGCPSPPSSLPPPPECSSLLPLFVIFPTPKHKQFWRVSKNIDIYIMRIQCATSPSLDVFPKLTSRETKMRSFFFRLDLLLSCRAGKKSKPKTERGKRWCTHLYPLLCQFLIKIIIVIKPVCVRMCAEDDDFQRLSKGGCREVCT